MDILDFVKAFDTISRDSKSWKRWARVRAFAPGCSLSSQYPGHCAHQRTFVQSRFSSGCAAMLPTCPGPYLFIACSLRCWLKECPVVGVALLTGKIITGNQHAEDTMALLRSPSSTDVALFLEHMETFAQA